MTERRYDRGRNRRRAVTMKDVAAAAGVAQSTVSRILNDTPGRISVSAVTRQRVQEIASELGYRPHPLARALRGAPTMLLGAVVRDITDPFFAGAVDALSVEAKERGYSVVLGHAGAKADEALALAAVLEARQCDAIVLLGDFRDERRLLEDLRRAPVGVVALWHGSERRGHPFPTVGVDNRAGIHAAMHHLTSRGHERIAFVGAASLGDIHERRAAYAEYLAAAGLPSVRGYVRQVPNTFAGGELALAALLRCSPAPTAIIAATDTLAIGLLHAAFELRVGVPVDLSIVGFDDIPMAAATVPGLTTVRMPLAEIMAAGIELAVGNGGDGEGDDGGARAPRMVFQPTLIVRGSTAAPAAA
ncbi:MAG: LacI family DNA-binding transcriptional regulator [Solirubrobacteraceae bacterium]|jgi:DNA-binding LacI/PurR family transcriptional regulator